MLAAFVSLMSKSELRIVPAEPVGSYPSRAKQAVGALLCFLVRASYLPRSVFPRS